MVVTYYIEEYLKFKKSEEQICIIRDCKMQKACVNCHFVSCTCYPTTWSVKKQKMHLSSKRRVTSQGSAEYPRTEQRNRLIIGSDSLTLHVYFFCVFISVPCYSRIVLVSNAAWVITRERERYDTCKIFDWLSHRKRGASNIYCFNEQRA